mgnify:CR=1 FL=1|jgi:hypothetical protein
MTPKEIDISFEEWDYTCGDGCCYDYGITLKVGDVEITDYADMNIEDTITKLLEHLGYKVNVNHVQQRTMGN